MELLTEAEVRQRLKIKDPRTLRKLIKSGQLRALKVGPYPTSAWRISEDDLAAYLEQQRLEVAAQ